MRLIFAMIFTILLGLGGGYFLWGGRVARLTESLSNMTLEYDTMRAELAARPPRDQQAGTADAAALGQTLGAIRDDLAAQKALLDQQGATLAQLSVAGGAGSCEAATKTLQVELDRCNADKKDLEARVTLQPREAGPVPPPTAPPVIPNENRY